MKRVKNFDAEPIEKTRWTREHSRTRDKLLNTAMRLVLMSGHVANLARMRHHKPGDQVRKTSLQYLRTTWTFASEKFVESHGGRAGWDRDVNKYLRRSRKAVA